MGSRFDNNGSVIAYLRKCREADELVKQVLKANSILIGFFFFFNFWNHEDTSIALLFSQRKLLHFKEDPCESTYCFYFEVEDTFCINERKQT